MFAAHSLFHEYVANTHSGIAERKKISNCNAVHSARCSDMSGLPDHLRDLCR
jgi:hypothetical protein